MANWRFEPNPRFEKEIEREVEYVTGLAERANVVRDNAKRIVRVEAYRLGDLMRGIETKQLGPRVYVASTDWKGHFYEWGTINNRRVAPIRRGAIEAGLRVKAQDKLHIGFTQVIRGVGMRDVRP